jgi:hypothetical protein
MRLNILNISSITTVIMKTTKINIFEGNKDAGWLGEKENWWFDLSFPHSYSIFDLDSFYEENYFKRDHVGSQVVQKYVTHVLEYGRRILGRDVHSVLELGCGGGWFTEEFLKRGVEIFAVEGTHGGYNRTLNRGVPANVLLRHDLRKPLDLNRTFDIIVCTEVAEHIECPFCSQFVQNIINHGNLVWFSFEEPATNEAHYHHCNERPEKFWLNLFKFYGRSALRLPKEVTRDCESRGDLIFFSDEIVLPEGMEKESEVGARSSESLGTIALGDTTIERLKKNIKQFVPPVFYPICRCCVSLVKRIAP